MSAELNADTPTPASPEAIQPSGAIELTDREIAIAEGRDPDAVEYPPVGEIAGDDDASLDSDANLRRSDEPEDDSANLRSEPPKSWVEDYDRQVASTYGIEEGELASFTSRDEFSRALQFARNHASRQAPVKDEPQPEASAEPEYVDQPIVNGKVNVEYWRKHKDEFEGGDVLLANAEHSAALEAKIADLDSRHAQQEQLAAQREIERQYADYHSTVDSHNPDFYGKQVDQFGNKLALTKVQESRREELFNEIYWLSQRIAHEQQMQGLPVAMPSWQQLVKQAEPRAFGAELNRMAEEKRLSDAKAQARTIRPAAGSSGAGHARRVSVPKNTENAAEIAQDPDVMAAWEKASVAGRR